MDAWKFYLDHLVRAFDTLTALDIAGNIVVDAAFAISLLTNGSIPLRGERNWIGNQKH